MPMYFSAKVVTGEKGKEKQISSNACFGTLKISKPEDHEPIRSNFLCILTFTGIKSNRNNQNKPCEKS